METLRNIERLQTRRLLGLRTPSSMEVLKIPLTSTCSGFARSVTNWHRAKSLRHGSKSDWVCNNYKGFSGVKISIPRGWNASVCGVQDDFYESMVCVRYLFDWTCGCFCDSIVSSDDLDCWFWHAACIVIVMKETRAQSEILKPNRCLEKAAEFWRERRSSPESRACHNGECLRDLTILKKACGLFEIRQAFFR